MYMRDRPMRDYMFMKVDKEALATAPLDVEPDPAHQEAQRRFLSAYNLPEHQGERLHPLAVYDLAEAMKRGPLPRWAASLLERHEIQAIKEVMKNGG